MSSTPGQVVDVATVKALLRELSLRRVSTQPHWFCPDQRLLPRADRTAGGCRTYDASSIERIEFIPRAQAHGLSLREVRELVRYQASPGRDGCRQVHDLLSRKLKDLRGVDELKVQFNQDAGHVRLVLLVSPT